MKSRIAQLEYLAYLDQYGIPKVLEPFREVADTPEHRSMLWSDLGPALCDAHLSFEQQHAIYQKLFEGDDVPLAWHPDAYPRSDTHLQLAIQDKGLSTYEAFFYWAANNRSAFWKYTLQQLRIPFHQSPESIQHPDGTAEHPKWLPGARMNIAEACFQAPKDQNAVVYASEDKPELQYLSYADLEARVNRVANGLQEKGYQPGDSAVIYMPLSVEAVFIFLGLIKAGLRAVLIADSFTAGELKRRSRLAAADLVFCSDAYLNGGKQLDIYDKVREAGPEKAVVVAYRGGAALRSQDEYLEDFLSPKTDFQAVSCDPYDISAVLFSSGTTKEPKAIPWTHLTPIKCASDAYYHHDVHPDDVVTWTTSMGWMMGPWAIFAALINQGTLALYTGLAAGASYGHFVQDSGITILGTIPSLVKIWRKNGIMPGLHWKVRLFSSTGEPSNAEDYLYLMSLVRYQAPIIEYCGGTEIGGGYLTGSLLQPASPATFTTPALGLDFVLAEEGETPSHERESGQVFLIPPSIGLSETLLNRDHHEEYFTGVPRTPEGDLLRRHGDAWEKVYQARSHKDDASPYCFYRSKGRVDDAMNLGGVKVSAVEIEGVLQSHQKIREAAAVAVPQEQGGPESLVVYIAPAEPLAEDLSGLRKELSRLLARELNPLFKIAEIRVKDPLPRTASNKLMRRALRSEYEASRKVV